MGYYSITRPLELGLGRDRPPDHPVGLLLLRLLLAAAIVGGAAYGVHQLELEYNPRTIIAIVGFGGTYLIFAFLVRPRIPKEGLVEVHVDYGNADRLNIILALLWVLLLPGRIVSDAIIDTFNLVAHGSTSGLAPSPDVHDEYDDDAFAEDDDDLAADDELADDFDDAADHRDDRRSSEQRDRFAALAYREPADSNLANIIGLVVLFVAMLAFAFAAAFVFLLKQ